MSLRVVFLSAEPEGVSARVRVRDHLEGLAAHGLDGELRALPAGLLRRRRALRGLEQADLVVLHRRLLDPLSLRWLRARARRLAFDLDDAIWERPFRAGSGRNRRRFRRLLTAVDGVLAGSRWLAGQIAHPRVLVVPPASPPPLRPPGPRPEGAGLRLVWTGSGATLPYLEAVAPVLAGALGPEDTLEVLAERPPALGPVPWLRWSPWSLEREEEVLSRADVGLYPLDGSPWSRGKCAYKVLRYQAFGLPTLGSRHGAGEETIAAPRAGLLADAPAEWEEGLARLRDPGLRRAMGAEAQALARGAHALPARTAELARALRDLAGG